MNHHRDQPGRLAVIPSAEGGTGKGSRGAPVDSNARPAPGGTTVEQARLTGERALFRASGLRVEDCVFADGESPLKESRDIALARTLFEWKYPLWYSRDVDVSHSALLETARSGIWYADGVRIADSTIDAPKTFRRSRRITLERVEMPRAEETLWSCQDVDLVDVTARGDYFGMNASRVTGERLRLSGNYAFDGAREVTLSNSRILAKDAFWNSRDVTVRDSLIVGEYLGWNSTNLTFENCTIQSLQGMCYIEGLTLRNCRLLDTTLAFEFSTVDAQVSTRIESVLNPRGGRIQAPEIGQIILDPDQVDPAATVFDVPGHAHAC